jgi:transposase
MPGAGVMTAAELLTEVAHKAFASAAHVATRAGLALVARRSGSPIRAEYSSRRSDKVLKRALLLSAFPASRGPISRNYYARKVRYGKRHNDALIAVARQRCDVLRAGTFYQPKSALMLDGSHRGTSP